MLNNLYDQWFCCLLQIGAGFPNANFFWQDGVKNPENVILESKMNFYFHLKNLPPKSLGKEVIDVQESNPNIPSLIQELEEHLRNLNLDPMKTSKRVWKRKVKQYILNKTREDLLLMMRKYKEKIDYDIMYFTAENLNVHIHARSIICNLEKME